MRKVRIATVRWVLHLINTTNSKAVHKYYTYLIQCQFHSSQGCDFIISQAVYCLVPIYSRYWLYDVYNIHISSGLHLLPQLPIKCFQFCLSKEWKEKQLLTWEKKTKQKLVFLLVWVETVPGTNAKSPDGAACSVSAAQQVFITHLEKIEGISHASDAVHRHTLPQIPCQGGAAVPVRGGSSSRISEIRNSHFLPHLIVNDGFIYTWQ